LATIRETILGGQNLEHGLGGRRIHGSGNRMGGRMPGIVRLVVDVHLHWVDLEAIVGRVEVFSDVRGTTWLADGTGDLALRCSGAKRVSRFLRGATMSIMEVRCLARLTPLQHSGTRGGFFTYMRMLIDLAFLGVGINCGSDMSDTDWS
jgi:hypothetical protein